MSVYNLARRAFFRRAVGGAIATMAAPAVLKANNSIGGSLMGLGPSNVRHNEDPISRAALDALEIRQERNRYKRAALHAKVGVLDYDIAERRAWSSAFKTHVQAGREVARFNEHREEQSTWQRMWRAVMGEDQ